MREGYQRNLFWRNRTVVLRIVDVRVDKVMTGN
jgi:hypothetical protein